MPRKPFLYYPELPYHITARCINREWFIDSFEVWHIMENYLYFISKAFGVEIFSFVLMANHFHLIARFPKANISEAMAYFMRETSRSISKDAERINQIYGSRFFRTALKTNQHFLHTYKYVYRNPVEAGQAQHVEDYPYSTLFGKLGSVKLGIPVVNDVTLFSDIERTLKWLNTNPLDEHKNAVKKALRKPIFKLAIKRSLRKPHPLEFDAY